MGLPRREHQKHETIGALSAAKKLVGPERFELPTCGFVDRCSIQLSYGPKTNNKNGAANGIRTRVRALKGHSPRPLDDGSKENSDAFADSS